MIEPKLLAGRYRVEHLLGKGGMGQVYAAFDTLLERRVAVKLLPEDAAADAHARARFHREALAAAALDHPYICKVLEVGEEDGRSFIVMEHIDGKTLDGPISDRSLTARQLLDLAHEAAQALDEAHRRGVVHRDLKPSNIMLTVQGHVKVLDFGLAKQTDGVSPAGTATTSATMTDVGVTRPGVRLGTPTYMSPEQVLGSPLDPRSDVFSLGIVLHELASGRHPFRKETPADTMAAILRDAPLSTEGDLDVVPGFGRIVLRMLAKACAERQQTMGEVRGDLDALRERGSSVTPANSAALERPAERTALVGRDAELAELAAHLDRMLLGHGGLVLLGGEPGVGKTRLARELQRLARDRGCVTLTGHCYEQEGAPPFGPFVESMESAARAYPQAMRTALGDEAAEIATMVPELRRHFPDIPPFRGVPIEQQRRVLFNAYLTYAQRATSRSAAVVLLDDLHWADESTVQLVQHVAPHLASMRILFVGTYRDVDLDAERPFARALETLVRQRQAARLNVRRLNASGVEQLLASMSGARPPASLVRAINEETDGNPFFIEEVFQHLREEGKLFDEEGGWKAGLRVDDIDVPEGVRLVISRRLQRLGADAKKVLAAAAVVGRSFPLDLLQAVCDQAEEVILDVLEEAARSQLLVEERGREVRYSFVHELIRSTLLADLSLPRRQRLHLRVADAIEQRRAGSIDSFISPLAHHLYQAGAAVDVDRAVSALTRAMRRAHASGALEETLTLGEQLASFDLAPDSDAGMISAELRADALWALARPRAAGEVAEVLLSSAIRRGEQRLIEWAAFLIGTAYVWTGRSNLATAMYDRVLAVISEKGYGQIRAGVLANFGQVLWTTGDLQRASAVNAEARAAWRAADTDDALTTIHATDASIHSLLGAPQKALEDVNAALKVAKPDRSRGLQRLAWPLMLKAIVLQATGRFAEFDEFALKLTAERGIALPIARMTVRQVAEQVALARHGDVQRYLGAMDSLARVAREGAGGYYEPHLAAAYVFVGNAEAAIEHASRAVAVTVVSRGTYDQACLMDALVWAGRADEARAIWSAIEHQVLSARVGDTSHWRALSSLGICATALPLLGERRGCGELYPTLDALAAAGYVCANGPGPTTSPNLAAAISAECDERIDSARAHYEAALQLAHALPDRLLQPTVRMWYGRFLVAQGNDEGARGLSYLREAAADFAVLGMPLHVGRATDWLREAEAH